ncbi:MAG: DUF1173 family protein [Anaerolineae bacterium]|nr:DUF1173 family protein [Anaerolineae bacterium]
MTEFCIEGVVTEKTSPDYQALLANAYKNKQRPLCLCNPKGIPMYISKLGDHYIVKRMPNSAVSHNPSCAIYELPPELTGLTPLKESAISEDEATGITTLRLEFSLTKKPGKAPPESNGTEVTTVKAQNSKMSLRAFLHYLYDSSGLNKFTQKEFSRRNWSTVRRALLESAAKLVSKQIPILDRILIPEMFKLDDKEKIATRLNKYFSKLSIDSDEVKIGILVGEVKSFSEARIGKKLIVKHLPNDPFFMEDKTYKNVAKHFDEVLSLWNENERYHLMIISTFYLSASKAPHVIEMSLMLSEENWIPIESTAEARLCTQLIGQNRHFIKPLRFNVPRSNFMPSAILTDMGDIPHPIYLLPPEPSENILEQLESIEASSGYEITAIQTDGSDVFSIPELQEQKPDSKTSCQTKVLTSGPEATSTSVVESEQAEMFT